MKATVKKIEHQAITVLPHEWTEDIVEGMTVNITQMKPQRTLDQNALYWKFAEYCGKQLQLTPEQLHEYLKFNILPEIKLIDRPSGQLTIRTCGSTRALSFTEFSNYFEQCNSMMIDMGVDTTEFWDVYERGKHD